MLWRDQKGQTTTEYLMIAGLITAVFPAAMAPTKGPSANWNG